MKVHLDLNSKIQSIIFIFLIELEKKRDLIDVSV